MKSGELRRFKDGPWGPDNDGFEGTTFVVLRVNAARDGRRTVDILIDGGLETDLGYFWVEDSSEVINEAG